MRPSRGRYMRADWVTDSIRTMSPNPRLVTWLDVGPLFWHQRFGRPWITFLGTVATPLTRQHYPNALTCGFRGSSPRKAPRCSTKPRARYTRGRGPCPTTTHPNAFTCGFHGSIPWHWSWGQPPKGGEALQFLATSLGIITVRWVDRLESLVVPFS